MRIATRLTSLLALLLARQATALPLDERQSQPSIRATACASLKQRVNWNVLTSDQKKSYFEAVKCLRSKPKQTQFEASKDLFDDFPAIHIQQDHNIHGVAAFLPWHRRFLQAREIALQSCGYAGPTPYWDWTAAADTSEPRKDPILSPLDGFGGIGRPNTEGGSVTVVEGPFANLTLHLVQGENDSPFFQPNQLRRSLEDRPDIVKGFTTASVQHAQSYSSFNDYRYYLEGIPHGAVHTFVGGSMMPSSSPQEPLFFLHHAQIDRLWALWQEQDRANRITDYAGNYYGADSLNGPFEAKIDDMMPSFGGLISDATVRDVMDTKAGDLCYEVSLVICCCSQPDFALLTLNCRPSTHLQYV